MDVAELQITADAKPVDKLDKSLAKLDGTAAKVEKSTDKLNKQNQQSSKAFSLASVGVGKLVLGLGALVSVSAGVRAGISIIKEYGAAMSQVAAISRATTQELALMERTARELGASTSFSATQAAEGMKFLAQAGFTAKESIAAIPQVLNLAKASALDLGTAADIASNVMSGFGIEAARSGEAVDILAGISSRANTDVFQLGEAASYVGPVARAMGISLGDVSAAIGVLSDAGIQGSSAGTGLRRVLSSLANPGKEASEVLKGLGVTLEEVDPATNSLTDVIDRLAATGMSAAEALTIFGDRGGPAILALTANSERVGELADEMTRVDGEAKRMSDTMSDNLQGDTEQLISAMQELALALGDAGVTNGLRAVVQGAVTTTRVFGFLLDETRALFGAINELDYARIADEVERLEGNIARMKALSWIVRDEDLAKQEAALAKYRAQLEALIPLNGTVKKTTNDMLDDAAKRLKVSNKLIDDTALALSALYKDAKQEGEEAAEAAIEFADSLQEIKDRADPLQAEINNLTREYDLMRKGVAAGLVTNEEWAAFLDYALPEVVVNAKRLTAEVKKLDEAADPLATSFNRGVERMRDGVGDFFEDFLQDGKASFSGILDLFKGLIAEMIATAAANQIFMGVGLVGAGGAATGTAAAQAALTGGGGITGLLSAAASGYKLLTGGTTASGATLGSTISGYGQSAYDFLGGGVFADGIANTGSSVIKAFGGTGSNVGYNTVAGGLATAGAGFVGGYAGQQVFQNENSTGAGAAVGTVAGAYVGSIVPVIGTAAGAAIGAFLGEGLEAGLQKLFGYKEGGNNAGGGAYDLGAGTSDLKLLGENGGKNLTAAEEMVATMQDFANAIGGSKAAGNLQVGAKDGIKFNGVKYENAEDFLQVAFDDIISGATNLSSVAKKILRDFDGGADELAGFAVSLSSINAMLESNPVERALDDIATVQEQAALSTMDVYVRQLASINTLINAYDGSATATATLNNAMVENQAAAYQMVIGIEQIRAQMSGMFTTSAQAIRESVMTEEQLFNQRKKERDELQNLLKVTDDATILQNTLAQINTLTNQMFQSIDDPTVQQAEAYASYLEETEARGERRLDAMVERIEATQANQIHLVNVMLQTSAARQEQSTQVFAAAVDVLADAINSSGGASGTEIQV